MEGVVEGGERADREPLPGRVIPSEGSDSDLRRVLYGIMVATVMARSSRRGMRERKRRREKREISAANDGVKDVKRKKGQVVRIGLAVEKKWWWWLQWCSVLFARIGEMPGEAIGWRAERRRTGTGLSG